MSLNHPRLAPFLLAVSLAGMAPATAQVPNTLLHSFFDPGTNVNVQTGMLQGWSVALDGNIAVVAAPDELSGVVRIYDATTGAHLHKLATPTGLPGQFGRPVAISGTRIAAAVSGANTVYIYDLASSTPTVYSTMLTNPSPAVDDYFGQSVAISGQRVVIGAKGNDTGAEAAGVAYVYDLASVTPTVPVATLTNPSPASEFFGDSVAIDGAKVVVATYLEFTGTIRGGNAYVYDLSSATPLRPSVTLTNPSPTAGEGTAVAISGTRVVVGTPREDAGATDTGRAYVYDLASATPTVPALTLTNPSPVVDDYFGQSVAISGTRVVVGTYSDNTGGSDAGSAYFYDLADVTPTVPVTTPTYPSPAANDRFGVSVAVSGTRAVIGADGPDIAYLYDFASAMPVVPAPVYTPARDDHFGFSVAVSGTRVVVGATLDDTGATNAGIAYVYDLANTTPTVPVFTLTNPSPQTSDFFGISVACSGTGVVIGVASNDTGATNAGLAYVYDLASATPALPVITLTNPSPAASDLFGNSVAIAGTRVVVGAYGDDTGAAGAGSVYVYDLAGATPTVPVITLNNTASAANFGWSVAISDTRVAIGAIGAGNGGRVYVYDLSSPTPTIPVSTLNNPSIGGGCAIRFGYAVAISGTRLVVGQRVCYDTVTTDVGTAYVYDLSSATPTMPVATLTNPSGVTYDYFGRTVAMSATWIIIGAYESGPGRAYVYDLTSATPTLPVATLDSPNSSFDHFTESVSMDGTTIVIGAPLVDTTAPDRGAAYVFGPRPVLNIVPAAPDFATISWTPATSSGFVLQCTDSFAPTNWVAAPSGAANPVTIPATNAARFYRLFQP